MGFGETSSRHNSGLSVLSFSGVFFTDDANSIIGIFFLRTALFLIAKSQSAIFGTKSLLFAVEGSNEVTGKDLGCGVLYGAQILLGLASPAWLCALAGECEGAVLGLCCLHPSAFGVSANCCHSTDPAVIIALLKVTNSPREQNFFLLYGSSSVWSY